MNNKEKQNHKEKQKLIIMQIHTRTLARYCRQQFEGKNIKKEIECPN